MTLHEPEPFALLLRRYRRERGLSQAALAEQAGVSLQAVSALERGLRHGPRVETVRLLGEALGLNDTQTAALDSAARRRRGAQQVATPLSPRSMGMPGALTPLIGRERDEAAMVDLLRGHPPGRDPHAGTPARLLTLTGPGGVGKTRLALQVAASVAPCFAGGVAWVDLAPLRDPHLVTTTIAHRLGVSGGGDMPLQEHLVHALREGDLLLVLDNFEHLLAARTLVTALLEGCPHLSILVTSRAALHARGEQEYALGPLALPDPAATAHAVEQAPAVLLFIQRARAVQPDLALTPETAMAVGELCRRLDGLPLAIELAAALVKLVPPQALLAQLGRPVPAGAGQGHPLDMLAGSAWDLPDRQQTLRATLDWSHTLLDAGEQALFRRLAVFAGGATLDAVQSVCPAPGEPPGKGRALADLRSLVDKSLLQSLQPEGGETRLRMLETVRAYALEHLEESGEGEATRERHAACYLALAEQAEAALNGPGQAAWFARLERDHDNLRAALAWALDGQQQHPDLALHLAGTLWRFWYDHGHIGEGRAWLARCLAADTGRLHAGTPARAKALNGAGWLATVQGDYTSGTALLEESLALYRAQGDPAGIASTLTNLAGVSYRHADYPRASTLYEHALTVAQACGDRPTTVNALNSLALIAREQGDHPRASALYEQCLAVSHQLGHLDYVARGSLGRLASEQGDYPRARVLLGDALHGARGVGDTTHAAGLVFDLALATRELGDLEGAMVLLQESADLHQEMGHQEGVGVSLLHLGLIAARRGAPGQAVQLCARALRLCARDGATPRLAGCFEGLAEALRAHGRPHQAARLCGAAQALRARIGAPLPARDRAAHDTTVRQLQATLGAAACTAAWQAGHGMALAQALIVAISHQPSAISHQPSATGECPGVEVTGHHDDAGQPEADR